ncbi:LOW QUALITY PROTEIN: CBS domain-containing protein, partial [Cephalotus follicularis]
TSDANVSADNQRLRDKKVKDLTVVDKRRLVEVPTATLSHTLNPLMANQVVAVPVAAPPGHWIGAGGSMIMAEDKKTGVVRKHYIGMVTMLYILAHIAGVDVVDGGDNESDLDRKMGAPVSSLIGHCLEGLSLWTLSPNTSILDCMGVFSKGIHRALVPKDGHMENITGVEPLESASSYQMITQMDLLRFLKNHNSSELDGIISRSVMELGAVNECVYAITDRTRVIDAIQCIRAGLLNAVPVVQSSDSLDEDPKQHINGRFRKLIGTFSSTDLRSCHLATLQKWLPLSAIEFTETVLTSSLYATSKTEISSRQLVTCHIDSPLAEVIDKAVTKHVHRVCVVDQECFLVDLISLTDIIRVIRVELVSYQHI